MRLPDWEIRLFGPEGVVEKARNMPFAWGTHDCGLFALGDWVEAVTGANPIDGLAGTYASEDEAMGVIRAHGAQDLESFAALYLTRRPGPQTARRGDIGIAEWKGRRTLMGVCGAHLAGPGERCLQFMPRTKLVVAFEVG